MMASSRLCLAITAGALLWPGVAAAHAPLACEGWGCVPWPVVPGAALATAAIAAVLLYALWPRLAGAERDRAPIEGRDWPVLVTRRDGGLIAANDAAGPVEPGRGTADEVLERLTRLTPTDLYRLARIAMQDGLATERIETEGDSAAPMLAAPMLVVTPDGRNRLVWQLMPAARLPALGSDAPDLDAAPFGYLRIDPCGGMQMNDVFDRVFAAEAADLLRDQVDAGILVAGRTSLPGADGRERLALTAVASHQGPAGETHEVFLFLPDSETATQVSAAETLEAIPVSLVQLDLEARILWGNAHARAMLGAGFAPGKVLDELVQPLGRSLDSLLGEVRSGRGETGGEMVRLRDADYETFAQVSLTRMVLQGQPCLIAVMNDASELRQLEDKFAQSQKMEAVGKLAGGIAHDFNNVLTAVSGHCDLLLLRKDASHPDFSDLMQIRQNANRAATLVRQLLAFSRKQTLQPKLLAVKDVVGETRYLLDRLIGENIVLAFEHDRDLGSVRADQQQLEQALINLVVNARDAMQAGGAQAGGAVTIATRNLAIAIEEPRPGIAIPVGEYVEISVSDQGPGIEPHVLDRVFDPFFTTKPKGEGTGLGLATVYGIVKQSGGYVYAENPEEGGARFTILLPRAAAEAEGAAPEAVPVAPTPDLTGQGAVMLVEDEAPVRSFASRALKLRGYRVIEAESADDAMALLTEGCEQIDVLVSDVVMPGMDGPTFAAKARSMRPDLRVIFISGYAEDSFRQNVMGSDFQFLPKPFSLNDLTAKVKTAMESRPMPAPAEERAPSALV